jgi:hypothetical protein
MAPMPRATSGATMTRQTTQATTGTTSNINKQATQATVLFQYGNWIGLPAHNQWGFDVLNLSGDYHQSLIAAKDFNALMECFSLYLHQTGALAGGQTSKTGISSATGVSRAGVSRGQVSNAGTNGRRGRTRQVPITSSAVGT